MIQLFTDVALGLFGRTRGGPAKVAVFSSGMMGTISGSGVANVVTIGQFTIPLMKRFGYRRAFAGGVEATASMGGQIMPPVMGAVAFIMAETLGVPYAEIVQGGRDSRDPLLRLGVLDGASRGRQARLVGMPRIGVPNRWKALVTRWYLAAAARGAGLHAVRGLHAALTPAWWASRSRCADPGRRITAGAPSALRPLLFWIGLGACRRRAVAYGLQIVPVVRRRRRVS